MKGPNGNLYLIISQVGGTLIFIVLSGYEILWGLESKDFQLEGSS